MDAVPATPNQPVMDRECPGAPLMMERHVASSRRSEVPPPFALPTPLPRCLYKPHGHTIGERQCRAALGIDIIAAPITPC